MILVAGIPTEGPVRMVLDALGRRRERVVLVNQRQVADLDLTYAVDERGVVDGLLRVGREHVSLHEISGIYLRLMDDTALPEVRGLPADAPLRRHSARFHADLLAWADVAPARVLNRTSAQASNGSKPYQAQLIARHGFLVPTTLVTNQPELAREFCQRHGRVVYKSISGVRSIVQTMGPADLDRLHLVRSCPVQFQVYVSGVDVRVHTVGSRVFATQVTSAATDYRYAVEQVDSPAVLEPADLPDDVGERCVALAAALGLEFAGIDLKRDGSHVTCFEVNPSPGFSYFQSHTGQPIADAVAAHLAGA